MYSYILRSFSCAFQWMCVWILSFHSNVSWYVYANRYINVLSPSKKKIVCIHIKTIIYQFIQNSLLWTFFFVGVGRHNFWWTYFNWTEKNGVISKLYEVYSWRNSVPKRTRIGNSFLIEWKYWKKWRNNNDEKNKKHTKLSAAFCDIIILVNVWKRCSRSYDQSKTMIQ